VSSASISRDDKGISKCFGFICFSKPVNASLACKEMSEKNLNFPGLPPLFVSFAMKKDDRQAQLQKDTNFFENSKFIARLADLDNVVRYNFI
jgi:polyadenylate-binding protein